MLPYLATILVLVLISSDRAKVRLTAPACLGKPFYAAVAPGELLALVGSSGLLEISARDANAAVRLGAGRGTRVRVLLK